MIRGTAIALILIALLAGSWTHVGPVSAQVNSNDNNIAVMDNCDPSDPNWAPTGGCALLRGTVSTAEFFSLLFSPLSGTIPVGHPSWRNEPSYVSTPIGKTVRVTNWGGRAHTFTKVASFGGGFVPLLNGTLVQAPECTPATAVILPPGGSQQVGGLAVGSHNFQCCIHPWMTATIEVN
jgi:plastocyanin